MNAEQYPIREFRDEDVEAIVSMMNVDRPDHRKFQVGSWRRMDARREPTEVLIRLVVGDPIVAFLEVTDFNTTPWKLADVCGMMAHVDYDARRQGIGTMLYERALAFADERSAKRLVASFRELSPDEPGIAFLTKRGFAEQERERPSYLDLTTFDAAPYQDSVQKAEQSGVRIFSYSEVPDNEENRRRLYELVVPLIFDIPRRDDQPFEMESFESWAKTVIERPEWTPELYMLAEIDGKWVGMSHIVPRLEDNVAMQWLTGVLKDYRGHGIATATKVKGYERARELGRGIITTENHDDNGPMLAINRKFGFIPEPPVVMYNKVLKE